jgi:hypothetical protein
MTPVSMMKLRELLRSEVLFEQCEDPETGLCAGV